MLSFPAHGPKRAYVALCALYPVCAELFLPYESSADRRPAKPKPLACYVERHPSSICSALIFWISSPKSNHLIFLCVFIGIVVRILGSFCGCLKGEQIRHLRLYLIQSLRKANGDLGDLLSILDFVFVISLILRSLGEII